MAPKRGRAPPPGFAWGEGPFRAGDEVRYWDANAGEVCVATVQRVDASVQPPAYVVLLRGGTPRDTEAPRLARVVSAEGDGVANEREAAPAPSPRRSVRGNSGGGASPQVVKAAGAGARRGTPRRGGDVAAAAPAEDRSPKRARASPAAAAGIGANRRRRAGSEEEELEEADGRQRGGMGLVSIAVTAMAVTTAALAALRRMQQ